MELELGLRHACANGRLDIQAKARLSGRGIRNKSRESRRYMVALGPTTLSLDGSKLNRAADRIVQLVFPEKGGLLFVFPWRKHWWEQASIGSAWAE